MLKGSNVEVASIDIGSKVSRSCKNVERHLRLAISDWYYFLSRLALASDTWLYDCDWWMKQVPSQLDLPWAFESIQAVVDRPGMLDILVIKVDEICLSMDRTKSTDFPKSMYELRSSLDSLVKEIEDARMEV